MASWGTKRLWNSGAQKDRAADDLTLGLVASTYGLSRKQEGGVCESSLSCVIRSKPAWTARQHPVSNQAELGHWNKQPPSEPQVSVRHFCSGGRAEPLGAQHCGGDTYCLVFRPILIPSFWPGKATLGFGRD